MTDAERNLVEYIGRNMEQLNNLIIKTDAAVKELVKLVYMRDVQVQVQEQEKEILKDRKNGKEKIL